MELNLSFFVNLHVLGIVLIIVGSLIAGFLLVAFLLSMTVGKTFDGLLTALTYRMGPGGGVYVPKTSVRDIFLTIVWVVVPICLIGGGIYCL